MKTIILLLTFPIISSFCRSEKIVSSNISSVDDTIQCKEISIKCINVYDQKFIIRNEKEYQGILEFAYPNCSFSLPEIDFMQYSLIGVAVPCSGCPEPQFEPYLLKIDQFSYKFIFNIKEYGMCKELLLINRWYLIPKIDDKVNVTFLIHKTKLNNK